MAIVVSLLEILHIVLQVAIWIVIAQVVLSWLVAFNVVNMSNDFVRSVYLGIDKLLAPLYRPIRRFMPDLGGLDLTPMVLILLFIAGQILIRGAITQIILGN